MHHIAELFILPDKGMRAVLIKTKNLSRGLSLKSIDWPFTLAHTLMEHQ
jgi:hypothetical protein